MKFTKDRWVDTKDELLARVLDAAASIKKHEDQLGIKKHEDQLGRKTRDIRTRVTKCIEVDGGIFENLLGTVTSVSFCVTDMSFRH